MVGLFLGLYGIYALLVANAGNAGTLTNLLGEDLRGYAPWILAIIFLAVLSEFETTKDMVKPIIGLLVLNFFLRNWNTVKSEGNKIFGVKMP